MPPSAGEYPKLAPRRSSTELGQRPRLGLAAGTGAVRADDLATTGWQHDALRGDVYYQVFVRSFADSDGDGIGDLAGLTARLDYLNDGDPTTDEDLGVDGLWLMPIFEPPSYCG